MNQHKRIIEEMERQYSLMSEAVIVSPSALAHGVYEQFTPGDEDLHIQYTSLEHLKHMARVFLAKRKGPDGDENLAHNAQGNLDLGTTFSGQIQDRYPLPARQGEEPAYKLRSELTPEEREWNAVQLEKSGFARLEHADALRAEGQVQAGAA